MPQHRRQDSDAARMRPTLAIFSHDTPELPRDHRRTPSLDWTLSELHEHYWLPMVFKPTGKSPKYAKEIRTSIRHWQRHTGDPQLAQIDQYTLAAFVNARANDPAKPPRGKFAKPLNPNADYERVSPNTIRKDCTHLEVVLAAAGRPTRKQPMGCHLFDHLPWFPKPDERIKLAEDNFELAEIEHILAAAKKMTYPRRSLPAGFTAPEYWKSLVLILWNTGWRIETLRMLRTEWIDFKPKVSVPAIVDLPAEAMKKNGARKFPLNDAATEVLWKLHSRFGAGPALPPMSYSRMRNLWKEELLPMTPIPVERHFCFHGIRKEVNNQAERVGGLGQAVMGHASGATTRKSYTHPDVKIEAAYKGLENMPQPKAADESQGMLF
ncbi:MAG: tyrosine-type recombinase/integrase [Pirellulales bacterium]|nr:tyrosine-type recombinase/integrase [Pirellulales bacterium]